MNSPDASLLWSAPFGLFGTYFGQGAWPRNPSRGDSAEQSSSPRLLPTRPSTGIVGGVFTVAGMVDAAVHRFSGKGDR